MRKVLITLLVIASFFRTETIWAGTPQWELNGNPQFIHYEAARHMWINTNNADAWMAGLNSETYSKVLGVPEKHRTVIVIRSDLARKPEIFCAASFFAAQKRRFVLVNIEQNILDLTAASDKQYRTWPHMGVLYIGTVAHQEGWDIVLWDELVQGQCDLTKLVQPDDVVGLSLVATGIERGVGLARKAKELGAACVIAGNDSAAFRVNQILSLPGKPIDAVFTSNRLTPVRYFFRHYGTKELSQLQTTGMVVEPGSIERSNVQSFLITEFKARKEQERQGTFDLEDVFIVPKLDLYLAHYWNEVWSNYREVFGHKHLHGTAPNALALLAQGCTRTRGTDVCSYCTIADVADIRIPSEDYLRRTLQAYDEFGIEIIFNATDSAYEMTGLVRKLQRVCASFHSLIIYGRAQGLARQPELLDEWQTLVEDRFLINVGMDSGDDRILAQGVDKSSLGKGSRLEENVQAVRNIKGSGAHLHYSLIFGSPGETIESCERSIGFLEWSIAELGQQLDLVETDIYWLNFGSPASEIFTSYEKAQVFAAIAGKEITREEWYEGFAQHSQELSVPMEVEATWYRHFTSIDLETAQAYNRRAATIMARHEGSIAGRAYRPEKS
ncbi:hypothetical protein KW807_00790 [Candidatus Parcubacteria bacterium]|nr:hypothetical protein [Candidatus Parcubacteria bacterium]